MSTRLSFDPDISEPGCTRNVRNTQSHHTHTDARASNDHKAKSNCYKTHLRGPKLIFPPILDYGTVWVYPTSSTSVFTHLRCREAKWGMYVSFGGVSGGNWHSDAARGQHLAMHQGHPCATRRISTAHVGFIHHHRSPTTLWDLFIIRPGGGVGFIHELGRPPPKFSTLITPKSIQPRVNS